MKTRKLFPTHSSFTAALTVLAAVVTQFASPTSAQAATYFWDGGVVNIVANGNAASGGTSGTWNTTIQNWDQSPSNSAHIAWPNLTTDTATFAGTVGTVTVSGTVNVSNIMVGVNAYAFSSGTINFPTAGAGGFIDVGTRNSVVFSTTLSGKVTFNATGNAGTVATTTMATISGNNTGLTSFELNTGGPTNAVLVSNAGAFGANGSPVKLTKGVFNYGAANGTTYNSWVTDFAGGALRQRVAGTGSTYSGNGTLSANTEFGAIAAATLIYSGTLDLGANTLTLAPQAAGFITLNGVVSGSGNLTVNNGPFTTANGLGTVTLGTANPSFTGTATTTTAKGTLALNNVNALQAATLNTGASSDVQAVTFIVAGNNTYNLGALTGSDALAIGANTISVGAKAVDASFSAIISGTGGKLTKVGANMLTLATSPTYDGLTTISAGTLALNNGIALAAASSVSLAAGGTLDVSANATYTWGASASLTASGTGTTALTDAAEIKGGATVDLATRPVILNFTPTSFSGDSAHPALYVSAGALNINSAITVVNNGASPLGNGTYILIRVVSGSSTGTPTLSGNVVGGQGLAAGKNALVQINGGTGDIELTVQDALTSTITLTRYTGTVDNSTYGDAVQFHASVTGAGPTPTGTVELRDGGPAGTLLGSGSLVDGTNIFSPALNAITAGAHTLYAVYSGDSTYLTGNNTLSQTVLVLPVTVSGASADNKAFDTTTTATLTGGTVVTAVSGDTSSDINANGGTFANVGPGSGITVTLVLGGAKAANYSLSSPPALTADIVASAIWTNVIGGAWSTVGNWTNNLVGSGANVTADFNTVNLTATTVVTNDTARTIGNLIFGDADITSAASWVVTNNTITLAGTTPTITVNTLGTSAKVTVNTILAGASGLTKNGAGTLALTGVNTYSGGTVVSDGTLTFNADTALGVASSANNITLNGGILGQVGSSVTLSSARSVTIGAGGGTFANITGAILTYGGIIGGSGLLTLNVPQGAATGMTLTGQSTNTGGATFIGSATSFIFMSASSTGVPGSLVSGPFGTGTITFNGPGTRSTTSGETTNGNAIIFAADTTFATAASEKTLTLTGPVTLSGNRTLTVNVGSTVAGKNVTITNVISDGGNNYSLTKAGTGTLVLSGPNTYGGNTTVSGGTLALSGGALITNTASIVVAGNAVFDVSGLSSTFTLASALGSQTLSNGAVNAIINGNNNTGSGTVSLVYDGVNPSFIVTNGGMTISSSTTININNPGAALTPGTYKIIAKATSGNAGLVAGTVPGSVTVVGGPSAGTPALSIVNGELYLTVGGTSSVGYAGTAFTYDGSSQTPTISFSGSTGLNTTNYEGTGATTYSSVNAPTNAGTYYVSNTVAADANYFGVVSSQSFTIGAKAASVTADNASKNYGQTVTFAGTEFTSSGLVGGNTVTSVTLTSSGATSSASVGTYSILASAATGTGLGNYTISYTNGTLTVNAATPVTVNSPVQLPDGNFQLTFTGGDMGVNYQIQASTDLSSPAWSILATNVATLSGIPSYTDTDATNHPVRFYRTVMP